MEKASENYFLLFRYSLRISGSEKEG